MKGGARWEWTGAAALAAAALAPAADTDLWWHLAAGREILRDWSVPRVEAASWTLAGTPWTDFEWLSQAAFAASHAVLGLWGVWLLKGLLLGAAGAGVLAAARAGALAAPARAAALALFGAGVLPRSDARTELFSLALFAWLLAVLERERAKGWTGAARPKAAGAAAALFALWANLHAGFPLGLALLAAYLIEPARRDRRWLAVLAAAAAGTLLNPFGWGVWGVLSGHAAEAGLLRGLILEWGPLEPWRLAHLGAWAVAAAAGAVVALACWRGRAPGWPELLALALAASSFRHARLCGYAAALSPLLAAAAARIAQGLWERRVPRRFAAGLCAWAAIVSLAAARPWRLASGPYDPVLVPERAAAWLASRERLKDLRLYNPWGWGGYLSERLGVPVFQDGRYLFHPLLVEQGKAVASPRAWQDFLERHGVELALMENEGLMRPARLRGADGREAAVERPYYLDYMPRESWALVWFDEAALVFARRDSLPEGALEYRWLRPRDGAALAAARELGLVDEAALAEERRRYEAETAGLRNNL